MERDFMGLNSRVVKEEFVEGRSEDSGFARGAGATWLFSNKVSVFSPSKSDQNDKEAKNPVQQFLVRPAGVSPSSALAAAVGATEQRGNIKAFDLPAQLTIFYGGSVSVFDNITPEKAKVIMCLAGQHPPPPYFDQQRLASGGTHVRNSGHASPISVSSHTPDVTNATACNDDELVKAEAPKMRPPPAVVPSAAPQARKASLARFLEKRKERVASSSPYMANKMPGSGSADRVGVEFRPPSGKEQ